ncbi:MAG TPA: Holliday junction branch migration protein RuvA [Patescibacteria group bacterium]|nr:Holliday junction branch migration protein RuvA [Patescibacteria group bacterium]
MMAYLQGNVLYHGVGYVIIDNGGIGFKITVPESVGHELRDVVSLYLHEAQRDDGRELFGFLAIEQLELFWKLVAISGVGPKSAQKIVFAELIESVKSKIMVGDLAFLTSVPGIGKKTAQKIILELKGALAEEPEFAALDADAIEALVGLGYSRRDAQAALSGIEEGDTESRIRLALKRLSR